VMTGSPFLAFLRFLIFAFISTGLICDAKVSSKGSSVLSIFLPWIRDGISSVSI
jgi:hypothetical protein